MGTTYMFQLVLKGKSSSKVNLLCCVTYCLSVNLKEFLWVQVLHRKENSSWCKSNGTTQSWTFHLESDTLPLFFHCLSTLFQSYAVLKGALLIILYIIMLIDSEIFATIITILPVQFKYFIEACHQIIQKF